MKVNNLDRLTKEQLIELVERTYISLELVAMNNPGLPMDILKASAMNTDSWSVINDPITES